MEKDMPLYDRLTEHIKLGRSSFHTPGHKGNFFTPELIKLDLTELPDTDALFEASGVILRCERAAARLFGAERSLISAGGCTLAIQAMLRIASLRGGRLLLARNSHRSAVNAAALLGIEPVWIMPEGGKSYTGRITPEAVEQAFDEHPDITACYITSPSYYGELCDVKGIAGVCHSHGALLLVDNAHGSHLAFMKENVHPLALGADMTACSLHKTLPVLTGGALLNISSGTLAECAKSAMSLFGSTSPSYMIMASIDKCISYMFSEGAAAYRKCEDDVGELKKLAAGLGIPQPEGHCDPLRLTLNTASRGISGERAQLDFFEKMNIDCEFCDGENAVMIFTPFNTERDILRVREAISELGKLREISEINGRNEVPPELPEKVLSLREAVLSIPEMISVADAAGRIAADTVCPCPPGVPLIMPGELIDEKIREALADNNIHKLMVCR